MSQSKYARDMPKIFKMENCTPIATPKAHGEHLWKEDGEPKVDKKQCRSICCSLIFLINIRPNLQFSLSLVVRYMSDP